MLNVSTAIPSVFKLNFSTCSSHLSSFFGSSNIHLLHLNLFFQSPPFHLLRLSYLKINMIQPLCFLYQPCLAMTNLTVYFTPYMDLLPILLHAQTLTSSIHLHTKHLCLNSLLANELPTLPSYCHSIYG